MKYKDMTSKELIYRKCKGSKLRKQILKQDFERSRQIFDKLLSKKERQYNRQQINSLENVCEVNPTKFWNKIKQLGSKKNDIPIKVYNGENLTDNLSLVLQHWENSFSQLYNPNLDVNKVYFDFAQGVN